MVIGCSEGLNTIDGELCNLFAGQTVIAGPSTFAAGYSFTVVSMTLGCDITDSTTAICSQTATLPDPDRPTDSTVTTTTTALASSDITYYPVTITGGALKTGDDASETTSSGSSSESTGESSSESPTGAVATGSGEGSGADRVGMGVSAAFVGGVVALMAGL
jgi:hypothetical protein